MFTISARGVYGLNAIVELALNYNKSPIQIKDIADAHGIPQHYLEQLLVVLKKAGVVISFRGSQGGYALSRPPEGISITEVLTSLEGRLEIVSAQKPTGMLSFFWSRLEKEIEKLLDINLAELVLQLQAHKKRLVYNI